MKEIRRPMDNRNMQQNPPSRNQSMGELPPVNPVEPSLNPEKAPTPRIPTRSKKPFIIGGLLVAVAVFGLGWWYMSIDHAASDTAEAPKSENKAVIPPEPTEPLLTYVGKNSNLKNEILVTDLRQKSIATLEQSDGKNRFRIVANNWGKVLVEESYVAEGAPADNAKKYVFLDKAGKTTPLSTEVATKLSSAGENRIYLGNDGSAYYVACDADSCNLVKQNTTSAETTSIYEVPFTKADGPNQNNTLELLGISWDNVACTIVYSETGTAPGTVTMLDTTTKETISEHQMSNNALHAPSLSLDGKKLVYTSFDDSKTIKIMDTTSGKTEDVKAEIPAGSIYAWSFDNHTAAFVGQAGTPAPESGVPLAIIDTKSKKITILNNYGIRATNMVEIGGWSSNTLIHFTHTAATTPNDFSGSVPTIYSIDSASNAITTNPLPLGYILVSPQSSAGVSQGSS